MASNPYVNKVEFGNQTVMDITDTTATEGDVASGAVFYKANGARSVGTATPSDPEWGEITGTLSDQTDLQTELNNKVITLTKAQYDALPTAEKNDPSKVYYVTDYEPPLAYVELDDTTTASDKVWSSQKVADYADSAYTLPTASASVKGGITIGNGLRMVGSAAQVKEGVGIWVNSNGTNLAGDFGRNFVSLNLDTSYTLRSLGEMISVSAEYTSAYDEDYFSYHRIAWAYLLQQASAIGYGIVITQATYSTRADFTLIVFPYSHVTLPANFDRLQVFF